MESAVQSYDIVAKRAEGSEKRPQGEGKGPLPIPEAKKQLVDACERYLQYAPNGEQSVQVAYKAANVYYKYNHFPEAVRLFTEIAEKHPKHELARYAANLALDCYNLQSDWRGMNATAKRLWEHGELMRAQPQLREDLAKVIEGSAFKLIEEMERGGRPLDAADAYLAFAKDWSGSKLAPTALYNASVGLTKAGRLERAMQVREQLVQRYPQDPLVPKVALANAQDREAVADFDRAADGYERYYAGWKKAALAANAPAPAKKGKGKRPAQAPAPRGDAGGYEEAKARDALFNAGVLREGLSQFKRAEGLRLDFVETWPAAPESPKVFLSVADLYARQGQPGKELKQLEEYQERFAKDPTEWLVVQDRIARLHARTGNAHAERKAYEEALAYWKPRRDRVAERGMPVVAQAQFLAVEPAFEEFDRIGFAVPGKLSPQRQVKWLKGQLEAKGAKLVALQKSYTAVVNTKQAEPAVCALWKIGDGYRRFARSLKDAPIPAELRRNKELADEYRAQLAQLAEAPEKKAVEALEYAVTRSRELSVANACSRAAADVLVKYKPDAYGPPLERFPEIEPKAASARPRGQGLLTALVQPAPAGARAEPEAERFAPLGSPAAAPA
ncbi:MAG TPA: hypothetical protein VFP65_18680, partial [Anaeromyxobacteraceae bacterium]|nr:hypothetical protein [Anaeromyxobacteraceae bacterium]